jgi:hypothetical protein
MGDSDRHTLADTDPKGPRSVANDYVRWRDWHDLEQKRSQSDAIERQPSKQPMEASIRQPGHRLSLHTRTRSARWVVVSIESARINWVINYE